MRDTEKSREKGRNKGHPSVSPALQVTAPVYSQSSAPSLPFESLQLPLYSSSKFSFLPKLASLHFCCLHLV